MGNAILLLYVLTSSFGLIALKLGSKTGAPISFVNSRLNLNLTGWAITGLTLYVISFVLYTYLISKHDLGYIVPLTTALVYTLIFGASFFLFKETFTVIKVMGIIAIFIGIVLLNIKK